MNCYLCKVEKLCSSLSEGKIERQMFVMAFPFSLRINNEGSWFPSPVLGMHGAYTEPCCPLARADTPGTPVPVWTGALGSRARAAMQRLYPKGWWCCQAD